MSAGEPDLPKDPAAYRPRPLLGAGFWAFIAFGILCVLAGAAVVLLGPRLWTAKPPAQAAPRAPPPQALAAPPPLAPPAAEVARIAAGEVAELRARIAALETQDARSTDAAGAALAAAAVMQLSQDSRPFAAELGALRKAAPALPISERLMQLAAAGAPSRAELALSFPEAAGRAAWRARKPGEAAGFGDQLAYAAARVVTIRRVDDISGSGPDSRLAAAEQFLKIGDVPAALRALDGLPPAAAQALARWRAGAERRAAIDGEVMTLRERAVRDLAVQRPANGGPAA